MYEYAVNKHTCPTDVTLQSVAIWSTIKWPVHYHNSLNISYYTIDNTRNMDWCSNWTLCVLIASYVCYDVILYVCNDGDVI